MSGHSPEDAELLRRYRDDDTEEDFAELVRRYVDMVYGFAYRSLRDAQSAEDVSQRVFTVLARKGKRQRIEHLSSWLYAVTQREVMFMMRSEARRRERERKASELEALASSEADDDSLNALSGVISSALQHLSEKDQKVLFLRFYEGQQFHEIATTLGVQERAAQKRVYRAMDRLRNVLHKRGVTATAAIFSGQLFTAGAAPAPAGLATSLSAGALHSASIGGGAAAVLSSLKWPLAVVGVGSVGVLAWEPTRDVLFPTPTALVESGVTGSESLLPKVGNFTNAPLAVDDIEGVYQLPVGSREAALMRLIAHLETQQDGTYFSDLFTRWTPLDAERNARAIVELASRLPEGADEREKQLGQLLRIPLTAWWRRGPEVVESWVSSLPRTDRGERVAFGSLVEVISAVDPLHAFEIVGNRAGTGERHYKVLANAFFAHGAENGRRLLAKLPEVASASASSSRDDAIVYQDAREPRLRLYEALLPSFLSDHPQETADWITSLPNDASVAGITASFVSLWAEQSPEAAARWVLELAPAERRESLPCLVETWLKQDEEQALGWIDAQSDHEDSTLFVSVAADHLGPSRSLSWAKTIPATPAREALLSQAFFALGLTESREELGAHLDALSSPTDKVAAARALAKGMLTGQGRGAIVSWRNAMEESEPDLSEALLLGELEVLAALNPHMASGLISKMPKDEARDAAVEVLLSRTLTRGESAREQAESWMDWLSSPERVSHWQAQLSEMDHTEASKTLPESLSSGFETQSYREFQERLDLLSTFPLKTR